ncbi:MAG: hypothetical protein KatS3mg031_2719 [Chitinophagales bacterium]|nr:MAG: hypothetical protein KatS3mg031_2719 [Chitinophagales bacterium]
MLKKIAILLFVLLIVQMALYARLYAKDCVNTSADIHMVLTDQSEAGKDHDIDAYLKALNIRTRVNEEELLSRYGSVKETAVGNQITISLENTLPINQVDIYSLTNGWVASVVNPSSRTITLGNEMLEAGTYIYKISSGSNLYCGTFIIN